MFIYKITSAFRRVKGDIYENFQNNVTCKPGNCAGFHFS